MTGPVKSAMSEIAQARRKLGNASCVQRVGHAVRESSAQHATSEQPRAGYPGELPEEGRRGLPCVPQSYAAPDNRILGRIGDVRELGIRATDSVGVKPMVLAFILEHVVRERREEREARRCRGRGSTHEPLRSGSRRAPTT